MSDLHELVTNQENLYINIKETKLESYILSFCFRSIFSQPILSTPTEYFMTRGLTVCARKHSPTTSVSDFGTWSSYIVGKFASRPY